MRSAHARTGIAQDCGVHKNEQMVNHRSGSGPLGERRKGKAAPQTVIRARYGTWLSQHVKRLWCGYVWSFSQLRTYVSCPSTNSSSNRSTESWPAEQVVNSPRSISIDDNDDDDEAGTGRLPA